jgi:2-methylisocitrate lyase-like PEP mutase family enzyme
VTDPQATVRQQRADRFLALHRPGEPFLLPNPWDLGSLRLLEHAGFEALATTSSGFAATRARLDGSVTEEETLAHAADLVDATELPVSADLENGFSDDPAGVAATVSAAVSAGLAGCSIEDFSGDPADPIYEAGLARDRVAAAVEAAHEGRTRIVLTARAENHLRGRDDLDDTLARLTAFAEVGSDVVYAPGLADLELIRRVVESVSCPVNVLALPGGPTVDQLAEVGVARVSIGGWFSLAAIGAVAEMAREFREDGVVGRPELLEAGREAREAAFGPSTT